MDEIKPDLDGLTPEAAAALIREAGSIDGAARRGHYPVGKFRRFARKHTLTAKSLDAYGNKEGYIYFARAVGTGFVKIGVAVDPWKRLGELQVGSHVPLRLDAIIWADDTVALERHFHAKFRKLRTRAEWFDFGTTAVSAVISDTPGRKSK